MTVLPNASQPIYRFQSAVEIRRTIRLSWGDDYPALPTMKIRHVSFSDLARADAFFVELKWDAPPISAEEIARRQRIYRMLREQFPRGSGVIFK